MIHPFNCKEATTRLAMQDIGEHVWHERALLRLHLWTCWFCRKYERQMKVIGLAMKENVENERKNTDTSAFKERLIKKLEKEEPK